ncbi:MAG: peptide/nickel transport system substrate-binding protein [Chloroflexota bacterium]|jgi:peptide/nickel transport system substrate-binding protein|nr:peptide/nickel transport system substrate-binding protein [Chloroflexota bacterium]
MPRHRSIVAVTLAWLVVLLGCAAPATPTAAPLSQGGGNAPVAQQPTGPKKIVAIIRGDPHTLINKLTAAGTSQFSGGDDLQDLVAAGLTQRDDRNALIPQIAEAVPSTENGLWVVNADGTMVTTWKIKANAIWQDGGPITSDDVVFTAEVGRDKGLPILNEVAYNSVQSIEAPDPRTIVVRWKQPFIDADALFSSRASLPIPRHLLEDAYAGDKSTFLQNPYWSQQYIGSGPFRVKEWQYDTSLTLVANDDYILGRPKIDEIDIRFVGDVNAIIANVLAGSGEMTIGRAISLEQARQAADAWQTGHADFRISGGLVVYPQFMNPTPDIVTNVAFRRALMYGVDRQSIADSLTHGLTTKSDSFLSTDYPGYDKIEPGIVKYAYDPRQSAQLMEGLGYAKGPDGLYRGANGQPLAVEIRVSDGDDLNKQATLSAADFWKQSGIEVDPSIIPQQRATDREYSATFPGLFLNRQVSDLRNMGNYRSAGTPLPSNNFTGQNRNRYVDPALDALIDKYFVTIPIDQRLGVVRDFLHTMTDQLLLLSMFYSEDASLVSNRLQNVSNKHTNLAWNAHLWDIQ